jgi:hypothetical protein
MHSVPIDITEVSERNTPASGSPHTSADLVVPARTEVRNIPRVFEQIPPRVDEVLLVDAATGLEIETGTIAHAPRSGLRVAEVPSLELPRRGGRWRLHALSDGRRLRTLPSERSGARASTAGARSVP